MKVQIWEIESLKFVTLMGSFCQNNVKFQLKKYRRVISWKWRLMQSLKTNWHKVSNMTRNFLNFHPNTQKSENLSSMGYFCPTYKRFELKKNTEELSFMTLNNFQHTLILSFQKWYEELGELLLEHSKSEKLYTDRLFLSKAYNVSAGKFQRNDTEGWCKI